MNWIDVVLGIGVACLFFGALWSAIKKYKDGSCCSGCQGACESCKARKNNEE